MLRRILQRQRRISGEIARELEAWEDTDDGKEWHEENGEEIASAVNSFWGLAQCEEVLNYDSVLETVEDFLRGLNRTGYRMTWANRCPAGQAITPIRSHAIY